MICHYELPSFQPSSGSLTTYWNKTMVVDDIFQDQQYADASSQNRQAPWQSIQSFPNYGAVNDPSSSLGQPYPQASWDYVRQLEERVRYLENELSIARSQLAMQSNPSYMVDHTPPQPSDVSYATESQPADEELSEPATESSTRRRKYVRKPRVCFFLVCKEETKCSLMNSQIQMLRTSP